jgi:hypothetical protein
MLLGLELVVLTGAHSGLLARVFDHAHMEDRDRMLGLMREAWFADVTELAPRDSILGRVSFWRASA